MRAPAWSVAVASRDGGADTAWRRNLEGDGSGTESGVSAGGEGPGPSPLCGPGDLRDLLARLQLTPLDDADGDDVPPLPGSPEQLSPHAAVAASLEELFGGQTFDGEFDADAGAEPLRLPDAAAPPSSSSTVAAVQPPSQQPQHQRQQPKPKAPVPRAPPPPRPPPANGLEVVQVVHVDLAGALDLRGILRCLPQGAPPLVVVTAASVLMDTTSFNALMDAAGLSALACATVRHATPAGDFTAVTSAVCCARGARLVLHNTEVFATCCAVRVGLHGALLQVVAVHVPVICGDDVAMSITQWIASTARTASTNAQSIAVGWCGALHAARVDQVLGGADFSGAGCVGWPAERRVYVAPGTRVADTSAVGEGGRAGAVGVLLVVANAEVEPPAEAAGGSSRAPRTMLRSCKVVRLERALCARFVNRQHLRQAGDAQGVARMNREISDIRRKLEQLKEQQQESAHAHRHKNDRHQRPSKPPNRDTSK